ncbi:MAG: MBL fold metallo-hydrolase, partial [Acutalibacter sp.]|nr:MBL fold metallo-hydrolase [Acutalibacter sp.]
LQSGVRRFVLAHLSRENNSPQLAEAASVAALTQAGYVREVDYLLETAPVENSQGRTVIF